MTSKYWLGKKLTERHKDNIKKSMQGKNKGRKGKTYVQLVGIDKANLWRSKVSKSVSIRNLGKQFSNETRLKISKNHADVKETNNPNWRGGLYPKIKIELNKERTGYEGKRWRKTVLKRDDYTCKSCGNKNQLEVHHIKSFTKYPELRFDIDNGITLCSDCHKNRELT